MTSKWIYPGEYRDPPDKPIIHIEKITPDLEPVNPDDPSFQGSHLCIIGRWDTRQEAIDYWNAHKKGFLECRDPSIPVRVTLKIYELVTTEVLLKHTPVLAEDSHSYSIEEHVQNTPNPDPHILKMYLDNKEGDK
jgi:hypothetical protein